MTELLDQAFQSLRALPPEMQDHLARMVLSAIGQDQTLVQLTAEEAADLEVSLAQAEAGHFSSEDEVRVVWAKFGL